MEQLQAFDHAVGCVFAVVFQPEGNHAAEAAHLLFGQFVVFVGGEAGVEHFIHRRMRFQAAGDFGGVFAMALHAQGQCFDAAQHQRAIHRPGHCTGVDQHMAHFACQFISFHHHQAHQHIGMAAQVFGGGMEHDVAAQINRGLQIRGGEGVVDAHQRARCFGFGRQRLNVDQAQ